MYINETELFKKIKSKSFDFTSIFNNYLKLQSIYKKANDLGLLRDLEVNYINNIKKSCDICEQENNEQIALILNDEDLKLEYSELDNLLSKNFNEYCITLTKQGDGKYNFAISAYKQFYKDPKDIEQQIDGVESEQAIRLLSNFNKNLIQASNIIKHTNNCGSFSFIIKADETNNLRDELSDELNAGDGQNIEGENLDGLSQEQDDMSNIKNHDAEEIRVGNSYMNSETGEIFFITALDSDKIITNFNDTFEKNIFNDNVNNGLFKRQASKIKADKKIDLKVEQLKQQLQSVSENISKKLAIEASIATLTENFEENLKKMKSISINRLNEKIDENDEIKKIMELSKKILVLKNSDSELKNKIEQLKIKLPNLDIIYTSRKEQFQKRTVSVQQAEEVIQRLKQYVNPTKIKEFEKVSEELFAFNARNENINLNSPTDSVEYNKQKDIIEDRIFKSNLKIISGFVDTIKNLFLSIKNFIVDVFIDTRESQKLNNDLDEILKEAI